MKCVSRKNCWFDLFLLQDCSRKTLLSSFGLQNEAFIDRGSPSALFLCSQVNLCSLCWNQRLFPAGSLVLSHSLSSCLEIFLLGIPSGSSIENGSIFCTKFIPLSLEYSAAMCCGGGRICLFLPFCFLLFFPPLFVEFSTTDETFQ